MTTITYDGKIIRTINSKIDDVAGWHNNGYGSCKIKGRDFIFRDYILTKRGDNYELNDDDLFPTEKQIKAKLEKYEKQRQKKELELKNETVNYPNKLSTVFHSMIEELNSFLYGGVVIDKTKCYVASLLEHLKGKPMYEVAEFMVSDVHIATLFLLMQPYENNDCNRLIPISLIHEWIVNKKPTAVNDRLVIQAHDNSKITHYLERKFANIETVSTSMLKIAKKAATDGVINKIKFYPDSVVKYLNADPYKLLFIYYVRFNAWLKIREISNQTSPITDLVEMFETTGPIGLKLMITGKHNVDSTAEQFYVYMFAKSGVLLLPEFSNAGLMPATMKELKNLPRIHMNNYKLPVPIVVNPLVRGGGSDIDSSDSDSD